MDQEELHWNSASHSPWYIFKNISHFITQKFLISLYQVEAYDYSQGFVDMMKNEQEKRGLDNLISYQGDSHQQEKMTENKFDLIFGCNLIDRLHTPIDWIKQSKVQR